uniref:Uncharacterized protein n=1 Tax=Oryza sativa subsp. japonica TaxID=39947 RepID=Q6K536_ORYSJ|nr:hypothetical protein [Oryza sativa Japonica Group]BAD28195.1 hypothetical protein [Oryza sativa Japonica Group]
MATITYAGLFIYICADYLRIELKDRRSHRTAVRHRLTHAARESGSAVQGGPACDWHGCRTTALCDCYGPAPQRRTAGSVPRNGAARPP